MRSIRERERDKDLIMDFDKDLDARGLNCPLPILRAKKALNEMPQELCHQRLKLHLRT